MTSKFLIFLAFFGMSATVPAVADEGRVAAKRADTTARSSAAAGPTIPLNAPKSEAAPLAEPYAILNTISIFAEDHRSADSRPIRRTERTVRSSQQVPVFRGVMIDENGPLALMEIPDGNGGTYKAYLREGQTVPWGDSRVVNITLDNMRLSSKPTYSWQSSWVDIPIGFNLSGEQIGTLPLAPGSGSWNAPTRGSPRPNWTGGTRAPRDIGSVGPVNPEVIAPLSPGNADEIEARMIQRRQNQVRELSNPTESPTETAAR